MSYTYPKAAALQSRFDRARTPLGSVPISTIYTSYDYPSLVGAAVASPPIESAYSGRCTKWGDLSDTVNKFLRRSRAATEARICDPYYKYHTGITYMPVPSMGKWVDGQMGTTLTFRSSPWNATGYYYAPRYPESYRGSASTRRRYQYY